MKKLSLCFLSCVLLTSFVVAQQGNGSKYVILSEDFESGALPSGWTNTYGAATYGWQFGTDLSSPYWTIPAHTTYAGANDDACNCDMSDVNLTTSSFSISAGGSALEFDYLSYSSSDVAEVLISVDGGATFTTLQTLTGSGGAWIDNYVIDLTAYSSANTLIRFHYNDAGSWAWGFCIDNVEITSPGADDMAVTGISPDMGFVGSVIYPVVTILNNGANVASTYSVNLKIKLGATEVYNENMPFIGQSLPPATSQDVVFTVPFTISSAGVYELKATVIMTNDANLANNSDSASLTALSIPPYNHFAYAVNIVDKSFNSVDLSTGVMDSISAFDVMDFPMSLEFIDNILYVFRISGQVDIVYSDGTLMPLGIISGLNSAPLAATYCDLDEKTYVIDYNDSVSTLYELDMNSLQATEIGVCDTGVYIAIEATQVGAIYGVNITDDNLYTIDRLTGVSTMIGNTGLAISFGQDISWDSNTGTLYGMLYDESLGGVFGTFDTSSGSFTNVSVPGDQIAAFAVNSAWTGIGETLGQSWLVFPNPADDYVELNLETEAFITINDLSGRLVLSRFAMPHEHLMVAELDAGLYIITCRTGKTVISEKLIIR